MRLTVVGTGYVGLVTGTCFADTGNDVVCVDVDADKIERLQAGQCPMYEPRLAELLRDNLQQGRLRFTTDIAEGVRHGQVIFIAVGTPPEDDGRADLSALHEAVESVARHADGDRILVIKSTVPVGTADALAERVRDLTPHRIVVVSNPEFLKQGSAVDDFLRPDRVVIGTDDPEAARLLERLHRPFVLNNRPVLHMARAAAEMTKYAANCYLATRISFINEIASLCEHYGVDVDQVRQGIGNDVRIGFHFLYPGVGYGGSCLPKDTQSMMHAAAQANYPCDLFRVVHAVNQHQREQFFRKIMQRFGGDVAGRRFAVWGASFKPRTDDIREAPALEIINRLLQARARVRVNDPRALDNIRRAFGERIDCCPDPYEALDGADALIICTEWNEYRSPDFGRIRQRLRQPLIFDGRNLFKGDLLAQEGFEYHSVGRPVHGHVELLPVAS